MGLRWIRGTTSVIYALGTGLYDVEYFFSLHLRQKHMARWLFFFFFKITPLSYDLLAAQETVIFSST